jgi:hypothetical protein
MYRFAGKRITFVLLSITFLGATLHAQVVGGSMEGTVADASGGGLPGVHVTVRNTETGNQRDLITRADGHYNAPSIPVGVYTVTAQKDGFQTAQRNGISLVIGQSITVDLALAVGEVAQEVSVTDAPPVVNLSTQQTSGLVDERQIKQLPLNGRSYDQLMTLNPATVNYTAQRSGSIGTSNSSVGNMFSVSGHRPQDNLFLLNGIEYTGASLINVTPGGTSGQLLGVEAVREFNVVADDYGANYGKRQGAQISIVTVSGTNQIHGSAYEFFRNSALDARNYFDQNVANGKRLPNFQRNNYGASLGGPIVRDKILLFANYEAYRQNLGLSDVTLVPDAASRAAADPSVRPLLALWPIANGPSIGSGIAKAFSSPLQHIRENFGTARFDWNQSPRDLLFATYTVDDSDATTPSANPLSSIYETIREQVLSVQQQHVITPNLLNTARIGFSRASFYFNSIVTTNDGSTPTPFVVGKPVGAIVIAGSTASNGQSQITQAGANVGSNNATARNLYTADDHIFYSRGKHQIEVGGLIQWVQSNDNLAQNQFGQAAFTNLTTFLQGTVATFSVVPSPTRLNWRSWQGAAYVEDTWKITPRFELRSGLRSESTNGWNEAHGRAANYLFTNGIINTNPTIGSNGLQTNNAKFLPSPRIGFSWDVFGSGRTAVRGGIGVYRSLFDTLNYRFDQAAPFNTTVQLKGVPVSSLAITPGTAAPAGSKISPSNTQPDIKTPTLLSWTLRLEQQLTPTTSLTIGYVGSRGNHQVLSGDTNEPANVVCPDPNCVAGLTPGTIYYPNTTFANPNVANTTSWFSGGNSFYHALQIDARRRYANGLQLRGVYTWAKNLDNGSAWNTSVSGNTPAFVSVPNYSRLDWGPSAADIRHLAAINGTYDLPFGKGHSLASTGFLSQALGGWTATTITTLQSGFPFSPQLGYNPTGSGDSRNPVRPSWNPNFRGSLYPRTPNQWFDANAFVAPYSKLSGTTIQGGAVGNVRRDSLIGPNSVTVDFGLSKSTQITERLRAQFRAEAFNILNHTNFALPNAVIIASVPQYAGSTTQPTDAQVAGAVSSAAGVITSAGTSRQLQFSLKLLF